MVTRSLLDALTALCLTLYGGLLGLILLGELRLARLRRRAAQITAAATAQATTEQQVTEQQASQSETGPPPPEPGSSEGAVSNEADDVIKIDLHPATCSEQAQRMAVVERSARQFAAILGLELTTTMRPPQVCYNLAVLLVFRAISAAAADDLLTTATQLRTQQASGQTATCPLCWLDGQLAVAVRSAPRRYAIEQVSRRYQGAKT